MNHPVQTVDMDVTLRTIQRLFSKLDLHHIVVREQGKPVGIINEIDVVRHLSPFIGNEHLERPQDLHTLRKCAHQIMNRELVSISPDATLPQAVRMMLTLKVEYLLVMDLHEHLQGIVTWRDLLPYFIGLRDEATKAA